MLGRQQIAGIPTAISELFKNAHDAYADHVEVDFYRSDGLFVLRDDGVGMDREDFESRWLTLGTESKLAALGGLPPPPTDPAKELRPVLGEKGIGRLAIAAIGPQVLVLSRPKLHDSQTKQRDELVAALIHWGLFQLPGVDLDEIEIPLRTLPGGTLPTGADIADMVAAMRANLNVLARHADPHLRDAIRAEIESFAVDPRKLDEALGPPSLAEGGHGTHFFIQPTDESLVPAIDGLAGEDIAPPLIKTLVGFTNTMTPGHPEPSIRAAFRDHKIEDVADDLIEERAFFTPEEFRNADHHIEGRFDEFGQFVGTVTVYGEPTVDHVVPWPRARGRTTDCGPFRINVAVVQGLATQSTLPTDDWVLMTRKLNRIGGLYIYRDGVRVLPYGNNDYDFLDIERQRTKSASDNYFSYRRMFGVIEIGREQNGDLVEKAGREGFRENRAYRQFREVLKNFFYQISFDFFREGGTHADRFRTRKDEIDRLEHARRAREKQVTAKRNAFRARLEEVLEKIRDGAPAKETLVVVGALGRGLAAAAAVRDPDGAALAFIEAEASARRALFDVRERYRVVPPRGVGLPRAVRRNLDIYRDQFDRLVPGVFELADARLEALVEETAARARVAIDRRIRFDRALTESTDEARRTVQTEAQKARTAANEVHERVTTLARESLADIDRVIKDVLSRSARLDVSRLGDSQFVAQRTQLEDEVRQIAETERLLLSGVVEELRNIVWSSNDDGTLGAVSDGAATALDMAEALEEEVLELRERSEADLELAQLGMAIQVINHEFEKTIQSVRTSIRELRAWADANEGLRGVYTNIHRNFDHLDGYLTLFTPLQRRLYRSKVAFTGSDVFKFLADLFEERLEREGVTIEASTRFKRHTITGYPSSFYPVFVNLIDNALYWLERSPEPRCIRLDAETGRIVVANSGPPIGELDRETIFEQGFTRRPGGRGLGLYISRQVLRREGYAIEVAEPPAGMQTAFVIEPVAARERGDPSPNVVPGEPSSEILSPERGTSR
ncbi:MAG TPA: ATP-binding protein [Thermoanaerobaculia bacterium]|nr:ATP-binding protein [Thermoanaerobaculia bacterium]